MSLKQLVIVRLIEPTGRERHQLGDTMTRLGQGSFLFILLLIPIAAKSARACSCELPETGKSVERQVLKARKQSKAVFVGRVREIITPTEPSSISVIFQVQTGWKGINSEAITILTGRDGSCGYHFKLGEVYLVYAYQSSITHFGTSICQRTQPFHADIIDLKYLGKPKFPTPPKTHP